jgi:phosphohistidine phosphatase
VKLWLLRHGQAHPQARSDAERELTEEGRFDVLQALEHLRDRPLSMVFVSPYVRAQQTAALLCAGLLRSVQACTVGWLRPESDACDSLAELQRVGENEEILLVSHQPFIGALGGLLIHGHGQQPLAMQTASLAELEGASILAGLMSLKALHHPRE